MIWPHSTSELRNALRAVAPEDRRFCVFGSGVMYLHGLRETVGDIDLFVTEALWHELRRRGWTTLSPAPFDPPFLEGPKSTGEPVMHAFYAWKTRGMLVDVPALLRDPQLQQGWPCQPLQQLAMWKASVAHHGTRPRDWDDVAKIARHLASRV